MAIGQEEGIALGPAQAIALGEDTDSEPEPVAIAQVRGIVRMLEVEIVWDEDIETRSDRKEEPRNGKDREPSVCQKPGRDIVLEIDRFGH